MTKVSLATPYELNKQETAICVHMHTNIDSRVTA